MNDVVGIILTIVNGALAIAVLALLISPKAKTTDVITASAGGFSTILQSAMSPVTGSY